LKTFISAKTTNQRLYIRSIVENDVTICRGPSGTGKSLVALGVALEHMMREDKPQTVLHVSRPMIATAQRDFPYIKGDLMEKLKPYYAAILANLEELLGKKELNSMIEKEKIVLQPVELMRGSTLKNCFFVCTESQNLTIAQAVMVITRLGTNCKMILEGDTDQKDIKGPDGLSYLIDKLGTRSDLCGTVQMCDKDILRHPLIGKILTQLNYQGSYNT
jgi:phosphate starvation-inducible PhoH-like protein